MTGSRLTRLYTSPMSRAQASVTAQACLAAARSPRGQRHGQQEAAEPGSGTGDVRDLPGLPGLQRGFVQVAGIQGDEGPACHGTGEAERVTQLPGYLQGTAAGGGHLRYPAAG